MNIPGYHPKGELELMVGEEVVDEVVDKVLDGEVDVVDGGWRDGEWGSGQVVDKEFFQLLVAGWKLLEYSCLPSEGEEDLLLI